MRVLFGEGGRGTHGLYENIPHKALHNQRVFLHKLPEIFQLTISLRWDWEFSMKSVAYTISLASKYMRQHVLYLLWFSSSLTCKCKFENDNSLY